MIKELLLLLLLLFSKSEDEYPMKEPALGFTMTPTKAQRNKVGPCTPRFCRWHG